MIKWNVDFEEGNVKDKDSARMGRDIVGLESYIKNIAC